MRSKPMAERKRGEKSNAFTKDLLREQGQMLHGGPVLVLAPSTGSLPLRSAPSAQIGRRRQRRR
jgi:hypothetical protein